MPCKGSLPRVEGGSRRDSAPHWRGQLPPSPPPEVSFIYTRTHTRAHPCARGGRTPSQVGWGLPRALLRCTKGAEQGLGCSPALAQPRLAFLFDFTFFFPLLPPHFISSLPSLSPLSGKALPTGEGWEGRESLGRQQIACGGRDEGILCRQRLWDLRHQQSPGGTLPKVSPRVAHPDAGSSFCSAPARKTRTGGDAGPQGLSP